MIAGGSSGYGSAVGGAAFNAGKNALPKKKYYTSRTSATSMSRPARRRTNYGTGGTPYYGGGNNYGGGTGGGGTTYKAPKPKPPPSLASWLARDADYQDQLRQFKRSLSDFTGDITRRRTKTTADYESGVKQMGEQRTKDLQDILNDFASRGLLKSGLYGQRSADYEKQYQTNLSELGKQHKSSLSDLDTESTQYKRQQALQKETARKEAARRRAEKYGI